MCSTAIFIAPSGSSTELSMEYKIPYHNWNTESKCIESPSSALHGLITLCMYMDQMVMWLYLPNWASLIILDTDHVTYNYCQKSCDLIIIPGNLALYVERWAVAWPGSPGSMADPLSHTNWVAEQWPSSAQHSFDAPYNSWNGSPNLNYLLCLVLEASRRRNLLVIIQ